MRKFGVPSGSLVVDIGSNDGTLLANFKKYGLQILGIEPADNIAKLAASRGVNTLNEFFCQQVAETVRTEIGPARAIFATNVFAHVHDLGSFLCEVDSLLAPEGVLVIEVPYLVDMLDKLEFDTIYHEHLSYFAVRPLVALFSKFNLGIVEVKRAAVHGGSLLLFVQKSAQSQSTTTRELLKLEEKLGLNSLEPYLKFAEKVAQVKEELVSLLRSLKGRGERIVGYGAPAKGNVLLNYCGIGADILDYIIDTTPFKQGRYTPGTHIEIFPEEQFHQHVPDYALLLAWNYVDEILQKEEQYRRLGGKFIVPIPRPHLV